MKTSKTLLIGLLGLSLLATTGHTQDDSMDLDSTVLDDATADVGSTPEVKAPLKKAMHRTRKKLKHTKRTTQKVHKKALKKQKNEKKKVS